MVIELISLKVRKDRLRFDGEVNLGYLEIETCCKLLINQFVVHFQDDEEDEDDELNGDIEIKEEVS